MASGQQHRVRPISGAGRVKQQRGYWKTWEFRRQEPGQQPGSGNVDAKTAATATTMDYEHDAFQINDRHHGTFLDHAKAYDGLGMAVIPVDGKKAKGQWKPFQKRRPDSETLRKLFSQDGITGLAVITGAVSGGLAIRDFDDSDAYITWAAANQADARRPPTVKPPRGYPLYGRLEKKTSADFGDGELGGDTRHYTLLPPSLHPDGP